jgi:ParB/RepB/Spo0J family partition protein
MPTVLRAPMRVADLLPLSQDAIEPSRQLVASVRRYGVVTPVILVDTGDGQGRRLVDGRRRVLAAKEAGLTHVEAVIYSFDREDARTFPAELLTLTLNELRRPNPVAEAEAIRRLLDRGAPLRDICRATGMSPARVKQRMRLLNLAAPLAQALSRGEITVGTAEAAAKLGSTEQRALADRLAERGKLTLEDVAEARSARRQSAQAALSLPMLPAVANSPQPQAKRAANTPTARDLYRALSLPLQQLVRAELAASGATWLLDALK